MTLDSLCGNKYYRNELTAIKYLQGKKILEKWRNFKKEQAVKPRASVNLKAERLLNVDMALKHPVKKPSFEDLSSSDGDDLPGETGKHTGRGERNAKLQETRKKK